ncbi:MAG: alpha-galactosidase, partial [Planctomycetaceae bacterium]|nr:alpha-galactosidase [Planctomycetaceae bacterium]
MTNCFTLGTFALLTNALLVIAGVASAANAQGVILNNGQLGRQVLDENGDLRTGTLRNDLGKLSARLDRSAEFAFVVRCKEEDARYTSADFLVQGHELISEGNVKSVVVNLSSRNAPIIVSVTYSIAADEPWMRKRLLVTAREDLVISKVEVEHLSIPGAYQPYRADQMLAQGRMEWRPPLGQPIYVSELGIWCGLEFPAAHNEAKDGVLVCGYLTEVALKQGQSYQTYSAAMGVADDPDFVKDAFLDYIDATRARPLRLQTQYNSWFDYHRDVDSEKFAASVRKLYAELVIDRGVPPLRAYVIDDGWQDIARNWSQEGVWPVNDKFPHDLQEAREAVHQAQGELGLWLSPGCLFGAQRAIPRMAAAGWRSLDPWMSMTGPQYMDALEARMVQLAASGIAFFKLDGVFGHVNTRNFDIDGFKGSEIELNDSSYDDAKERYLALGSERLMKIFQRMGEANPDVYIVISNGAFLSPWWLQHVDAVWMINAGDAAKGEDRTGELVYRDSAYYQLASDSADSTQFPLNSLFNHEPKKTSSGETPDVFRRYLFMSLSRGTGFVELYLNTFQLSQTDWDVLAEGMKWVHRMFPNFRRARMIGGNPAENQVYGFTGWTETTGYLSLHNPSDREVTFRVTLNRRLGLPKSVAESEAVFA